jgi:hypothetical protein
MCYNNGKFEEGSMKEEAEAKTESPLFLSKLTNISIVGLLISVAIALAVILTVPHYPDTHEHSFKIVTSTITATMLVSYIPVMAILVLLEEFMRRSIHRTRT